MQSNGSAIATEMYRLIEILIIVSHIKKSILPLTGCRINYYVTKHEKEREIPIVLSSSVDKLRLKAGNNSPVSDGIFTI
jgi:hypothetical protein